jgi:NAD(P)-dependent dehydrogenase (short-subunit alcohol dehydrogenase family)
MARELDARCAAAGLPVTAVCLHPGFIHTNLGRDFPGMPRWAQSIVYALMRPMLKSKRQGAACQVYCATAPGIAGGEYYDDCNVAKSTALAHNAVAGRALWDESERLIAQLCP